MLRLTERLRAGAATMAIRDMSDLGSVSYVMLLHHGCSALVCGKSHRSPLSYSTLLVGILRQEYKY